jgi:endonuclease/exonuclease/phosphatase (EEP) superfamily protein YafD
VRVTRAVPEGAPRLSLLLSNVSLENRNDALPMLLVSRYAPDVLGFIEVDARWLRVLDAGLPDHPHRVRADARDDHYGIALYSRWPLLSAETLPVNDRRYPALLVELMVGARPVRVLLAHAHPPFQVRVARMRDRQLARVAEIRRAHPGPFVLLGDLNATPWSHPFRALLEATDLRDTRRGFGLQATWPAGLPLGRIPLDHCLASPEWVVVRRDVGPPVGSDHLPVFVELALAGPS